MGGLGHGDEPGARGCTQQEPPGRVGAPCEPLRRSFSARECRYRLLLSTTTMTYSACFPAAVATVPQVSHRDGNGHLIASHFEGVGDPGRASSKRSQRPPPAAGPEGVPGRASPSSSSGTQEGGRDASGDASPGSGRAENGVGAGGAGGVVHARGEGTRAGGGETATVAGQGAAAEDDGDVIEEFDLTARGHGGTGSVGAVGSRDGLMFSRELLQEYVLMCSQQLEGGLRDKPGK